VSITSCASPHGARAATARESLVSTSRRAVEWPLLGRRGVRAASIDALLQRMSAHDLLGTSPRRRRKPVDPAFAEPFRHTRIVRRHPRRILIAAHHLTLPPIAHDVWAFNGVAILVKATVGDSRERRLAHRFCRRQFQRFLALAEKGPTASVHLSPLLGGAATERVGFVECSHRHIQRAVSPPCPLRVQRSSSHCLACGLHHYLYHLGLFVLVQSVRVLCLFSSSVDCLLRSFSLGT
jgi:hypothetical protein